MAPCWADSLHGELVRFTRALATSARLWLDSDLLLNMTPGTGRGLVAPRLVPERASNADFFTTTSGTGRIGSGGTRWARAGLELRLDVSAYPCGK